jgi:hypothetical protein
VRVSILSEKWAFVHDKSLTEALRGYSTEPVGAKADAASCDLQTVNSDVALNFRIEPAKVVSILP